MTLQYSVIFFAIPFCCFRVVLQSVAQNADAPQSKLPQGISPDGLIWQMESGIIAPCVAESANCKALLPIIKQNKSPQDYATGPAFGAG